jgi:hypothetical protein
MEQRSVVGPRQGPCSERASAAYLTTLTDSASHLRNLRRRLSLVQASARPLPQLNPLPPVVDDRLVFTFSRARKSMLPPYAPNRIASEVYPIPAPPRHEFLPGANSRLIGRDAVVTWK